MRSTALDIQTPAVPLISNCLNRLVVCTVLDTSVLLHPTLVAYKIVVGLRKS